MTLLKFLPLKKAANDCKNKEFNSEKLSIDAAITTTICAIINNAREDEIDDIAETIYINTDHFSDRTEIDTISAVLAKKLHELRAAKLIDYINKED